MAEALVEAVSKAQPDLAEITELAAELARDQAGALIADLSRTNRRVVGRLVSRALDEGWSDTALRTRIATVVGLDERSANAVENMRRGLADAGKKPGQIDRQAKAYAKRLLKQRAALIAEHELRQSLNDAQRALWLQQQQIGDLSAYAVRVTRVHKDERLCSICRPQNGRRRSLKDRTGPPFHPRCRCEEELVDQGVAKMVGPEGSSLYIPAPLPHVRGCKCDECKKKRKVRKDDERLSDMTDVTKAITPGGRVGDDSSLDRSPKKNWVENAGGLPKYIRMVAHALIRSGKDRSKAIGMAVGIVRNWAEGKGNVSPKVRAAAAKAIAEWEAKKAKSHVGKSEITKWDFEDYQDMLEQLDSEGY